MITSTTVKATKLTAKNVSHIFEKCVQSTSRAHINGSTVEVEGIHKNFVFNKKVLDSERQHIEDMLKELPRGFKKGWSFGEMYHTENGHQWANNMKDMEALMVLGVAIGKLKYPVPKVLWWSLPGGMPYIILN